MVNILNEKDRFIEKEESLIKITNYIINNFHNPIKESLDELGFLAGKVAEVHGPSHKELITVNEIVEGLIPVLENHFDKEGQILHPLMEEIDIANKNNEDYAGGHCGSISNPISQMEYEHESYSDMLKELRKLTNNYKVPEDACKTYTKLLESLSKLDKDLTRHTNIENTILHPKAIAMEEKVMGNSASCGGGTCGGNEFDF